MTAITKARLTGRTWIFDPPAVEKFAEPVAQVRWGRTTQVEPARLEVHRDHAGPKSWTLATLHGRRVRRDGTYGMYWTTIAWGDDDLHEAPEWVREAVASTLPEASR